MTLAQIQQRKASKAPVTVGGIAYMLREVYLNLGHTQESIEQRLSADYTRLETILR